MNKNAQKMLGTLSEIRSKLLAMAGEEGDDIVEKRAALTTELGETETAFRAALTAAPEAPDASPGSTDGESAEIRALVAGVAIADYFKPAFGGRTIEGRAAELNAAFGAPLHGGSGGPVVPWRLLRSEHRAFSTTGSYDGPTVQRPILQELFGPGIMDTLGVRIDDAGVGATEYPLLVGGVLPVQTKEETAAGAAVAATFTVAALKPKRLSAKIEFTHEQSASVAGLEAAYKINLVDALRSRMQFEILNGTAPTAQQPQRVEGFFAKIAAPGNPAAIADYADYAGAHAVAVDGIHAEMETQVSSVIGDATYRHAAGVYQAGSGESGSEALGRRSRVCVASSYVPDPAGTRQAAMFHAAGPEGGAMRGDSVAAMWAGGVEVIRDPYTQASQGVVLTAIALWDAYTRLRTDAYARGIYQVEA